MKTILSFPFGGMGTKEGPFSSSRFFTDIVTSLFDVLPAYISCYTEKQNSQKAVLLLLLQRTYVHRFLPETSTYPAVISARRAG